jgi:hypothetical protein
MAAPPTIPTPPKSRGHTLFDRQAQLHAYDTDKSSNTISDTTLSQQKLVRPIISAPVPTPSVINHQPYSPSLVRHRSPLPSSECYLQTNNNNNVQLIGIHPRPESIYIKESPLLPSSIPAKTSEQLLETDFPLVENPTIQESEPIVNNIMPSDSLCCAMVEQAFDYLQTHDDDDDVIHDKNRDDPSFNVDNYYNEENSDGNDSVDTIDLDATTSTNHQNDSKFYSYYSYCCQFNSICLSDLIESCQVFFFKLII